ncbi:MAG TPA: GNAT family N-acetyltransferase [Candidatus Saccharimonadales bacterium]|nr:GNAT family N-acetyltransferase [Candidatus Saccharimonadales bacterium]
MNISVEHLPLGSDLTAAFEIRRKVFQEEDGIPRDADFDGEDLLAEQFIAHDGGLDIGTARYRTIKGRAKIERVAVLSEYRGQSVGKQIMLSMIEDIGARGITDIYMNSKSSTSPFYERLGFEVEGDEFMDVGIPHVRMTMHLPGQNESE